MKHLRSLSLLALVAVLGIAMVGCSDDVNAPTDDPIGSDNFDTINLDDPTGGLTPTDEEVGFGDAFLLQEEARENEELYNDALMADPEVARMVAEADSSDGERPMRRSYFLRVVWGNLDGPVDEATGEVVDLSRMDWSGALQIDQGVVIVRRLIRFERGVDSITRPRESRQLVEWTSFTGGHFDGILFQIIEPAKPADSLAPDYANKVKFTAGSINAEFLTTDIPGMDRTAEVDDLNSIHFVGFEHSGKLACPRGFMAGIWRDLPDQNGGAFRGRWVNILGTTRGFMMGRYGVNENGERVFRGKYISRSGQFMGFLVGTWAPTGDRPGVGHFRGKWINDTATVEGHLGGRYIRAGDRPGGFYQGRWVASCERDAEELVRF